MGGVKYSEKEPRVEGSYQAQAQNIAWVGGVNNYLTLKLKPEDKVVEFNGNANVYIDGALVGGSGRYNLSNNSTFQASYSQLTQGDVTSSWSYKIW